MKARLIASSWHFIASSLIISIFLSTVYFIWYPKPFYTIHAVFDAVKIALAVDLILGPLLTFVVFNASKPREVIYRDIAVIVFFQLAALSWGVHITYKMRPVFFVYQGGTFYSIIKEEIDIENLSENIASPGVLQQPKPVYVAPLSKQEAVQRLNDILQGVKVEGDMYQTKRYRQLSMQTGSQDMQKVLEHATAYSTLLKSKTWESKLERFLADEGQDGENYLFYSVENTGRFSGIIIFNKKDFSFAGLLE